MTFTGLHAGLVVSGFHDETSTTHVCFQRLKGKHMLSNLVDYIVLNN